MGEVTVIQAIIVFKKALTSRLTHRKLINANALKNYLYLIRVL